MGSDSQTEPAGRGAVTFKSIVFGLLGVLFVSGLAGFHDGRITPFPPMIGTHMPLGAFIYILAVAVLWNLSWVRLCQRLVLNPRELLVVTGMTFMACFPPTSGLCRYFHRQLILPWYHLAAGGKTDWEKFEVLSYLPGKLFPQPVPTITNGVVTVDETVYRGFFNGLAQGNQTLDLGQLPLGAWVEPLMYWAPLVILMSICVMALSLLVHQQWAHHEQLSYPLAQVASSFIGRKEGRGVPDLFRSRLFWWGFLPLFLLYAVDYLHQWFPVYVPGMKDVLPNFKTWSVGLDLKLPVLKKCPDFRFLQIQVMYFSVVGLAYFVSSEISLTMGVSAVLLALVGVVFFGITGTPLSTGDLEFSRAGAYIGFALILLYTGRHYYGAVLRKAFGRGCALAHEVPAVLAARLMLVSFAGMVGVLSLMGLDWMVALLFTLLLMLLFLVFTRIICETGIPFMQANWMPGTLLVSLMGPAAIGPGPMIFVLYLGTILCQDPRESLMPFVATSIKMADDMKVKVTRIFWVLVGAVIVALGVAFLSNFWTLYNFGSITSDGWASKFVPTLCFDSAAREISELSEPGQLAESRALDGFAKWKLFSPSLLAVGYMGVGFVLVLAFSLLRFRFARFPLHPVLFLVAGSYPANVCWASFLVGWFIKGLVVRFGGGKVYQDLKPLFVGIVAGELIAVGIAVVVDMVYYAITGEVPPVKFQVMPG
jgi:hypothetical protein